MFLAANSDRSKVMVTKCEKCGLDGYIFPDQLPEGQRLRVGQLWYSKCCNGRKRQERRCRCKGFLSPDRAIRLQNIRKRGTNLSKGIGYSM